MQVMDLTNCFSKDPAVTSKSSDLTVEQLIDAITFVYEGDLSSYRKVAIVDDVLASGKTASAMLHHLYAAGLSKEAVVHVCAPLWINK